MYFVAVIAVIKYYMTDAMKRASAIYWYVLVCIGMYTREQGAKVNNKTSMIIQINDH